MSGNISNLAIKKLYALSAGRCNICKESVFQEYVHIGEMAHVIAKSPKGARGNEMTPNNNSYENLILLCSNHHTIVDNDPLNYTIEKLHEIKMEHELYISNATDSNAHAIKKRKSDVQFLNNFFHYTPFDRVPSLIDTLPNSYHLDLSIFDDQFDNILKDLPASYPLNDSILHEKFNNFINDYFKMDLYLSGIYPVSEYRMIEVFKNVNSNHKCFFNYKELPFEVANKIESELLTAKHNFLSAYKKLIEYLRAYYPEVEIYSKT